MTVPPGPTTDSRPDAGAPDRRRARLLATVTAAVIGVAVAISGGAVPAERPAASTPVPPAVTTRDLPPSASEVEAVTVDQLPAVGRVVSAGRYTNSGYRSQAKAMAKKYGLTVRWVKGNACPGVKNSIGCYTSGKTRITLSTALRRYPKKAVRFVVAHEASHHKIYLRCGTARPPISGKRAENVTDAYAAKVLRVTGATGYGYTRSDVTKAKKIKAGTCWSKQKTVKAKSTGEKFLALTTFRTRYTVTKGTRLTLLGKIENGYYVVRDRAGRRGYVSSLAWKAPSRTVTATGKSGVVWRYGTGAASRPLKAGERFGILRSHDKNYNLARASNGRLVLVSKRGF
ncbi:SH3 domain-containing protein [Isoptericola sp. NEAU-Y5]|uniref:SH3 domain-containing protein n=1 Tax=Isoptericola luteus TaxID=2879484 RepID=A0ABS7ZGK4_9MICO|nr:SH3 domain-containing protein [Isoptericola sp. NEAU-Y5]MCA5893632.1 SH3 domain-containing protein [Isoptericola sp. NEAU-Y5]